MKIIKKSGLLRKELALQRGKGSRIGFVPTMGYLHEGHLSLVRQARKENDIVVVSIFVNPLQFAPNEDLGNYPRDLKRDSKLLKGFCDILFVPSAHELYAEDFCSTVEVKGLSEALCGLSRKGHFTGVTTVVAKLFNIVSADNAYFGQKDVQQAAIIKKMVSDLDFAVKVHISPIVREKDGLAMSSRNVYLTSEEREQAVVLFQSLKSAERMSASGVREVAKIRQALQDFIGHTPLARIDYIEIVDSKTLIPLVRIEKEALLLLAVYIGKTRLIDNTILKIK